ncbi:uncharacterized protein LOC124153192 [Ischnura elegans]|uniref:uncharacterized protein LOC124153192 n=1 Tax=Ischnura elegans TaxID=197161 RepID=UPI001ED8A365|nr:uncharacterized protein LOC124153192 [Ischnura elegans]
MPPLPMVPHQQQSLSERSQLEGRQGEMLPGAPEAPSPPLHTHSSKFPIEREVIVSSAEKTSDTFKAKIPLIQDYGKRLVGGVVGGSGVGGMVGGGGVRGTGVGMSAVAPDAPVKQMAWTEGAGKAAGRKVGPNVPQKHQLPHPHHKPPPNTVSHGGIYGQHFQSPDVQNRQMCEPVNQHHFNGQKTGAIPRRDWSPMRATDNDGVGHRSHGEYVQPHQQSAMNDSGMKWSSRNAMQSGMYGSVTQCNPNPHKAESTQEDVKGDGAVANSGASQKVDDTDVDHQQSRTDFDVEANTGDSDKCGGGRLSNQQASSKASRTYHHIKDMISSRFGGGSKSSREGGVGGGSGVGGDGEGGGMESSTTVARGAGKEGGRQQQPGLNNSGCTSNVNLTEVRGSPRPQPCTPQQPSNRKSNNLGEREEGQQRMESHYHQAAQQFRKTDNNSSNRPEIGPGIKEQCVDQPHGGVRRDPVHQKGYQWGASQAGDDYGQAGIQRSVYRDGLEAARQRAGSNLQLDDEHRDHRREDTSAADSVLRESVTLEFSMGSMGIGEPAFYSTPVGEQGKQNNAAKLSGSFALNGSEGDASAMMQNMRPQQQGNTGHPADQGFSNSNYSRLGGEAKAVVGGRKGEEGGGAGGSKMASGVGRDGVPVRGGGEGPGGDRGREEEEDGDDKDQGRGGGFLYQEGVVASTSVTIDLGSGSGSLGGGGSSDYEKATHRSGRSTSTDSGRGTAGQGIVGGSRKGTPHEERRERRGSGGRGLDAPGATRLDGVGADRGNMHHPGSRNPLYGHGGQRPPHDSEWVDVVESELQQILDPKLHSMDGGYGMTTVSGVANSVVSESMSMTPPLPPLSPGGSPPSSPLCARKDGGKHYKLSSSMPYINKPSGHGDRKGGSSHLLVQGGVPPHHMATQGKGVGEGSGAAAARLYQTVSHPSGISMSASKGGRQQERMGGGVRGGISMDAGSGGPGRWMGNGPGTSKQGPGPGFVDRGRMPMRKDLQYHGGPGSSMKPMLGNAVPLASFGAPPGFDNGDMTSTTTGLDLDSMLDGPTENTSEEDMSATIDTTDAHAIRKQLEGLENMYSEVLKLLGVKKHGSRYQPSDPRINKRRMYGSLSSLPSSASSRPVRDKRRHDDRKKVKDIKGINKRFQRLESHVVTLARSVAHLSSEMRTQHLMMQEIETMRGEIAQLRSQPMRAPSVPWLNTKAPIEKDSFCNNVPALTNPDRVKKLTKFFGDEPPLLRIFLKKLGYEKYASAFEHERIGLVELPYLTEERLQKMGIPMGPRLRILQEAQMSFCQENVSVYVV